MNFIPTQFAEVTEPEGGLGAFNLNLKDFVIQLITFLLVFLILRRWVVPRVVETLDKRRETLEQSLENARATEEALALAQKRAEDILNRARAQADEALAEAKDAAAGIIGKAEAAAAERANLIIKEAESRLAQEREKLRGELHAQLANLVADATEKIIHEKLDEQRDSSLIKRAIKGIAG